LRTVHEPFCPVGVAETSPAPPLLFGALPGGADAGAFNRTKFQPWEVGIIKIDGIPVWILKLLPSDHLRATNACSLLEYYHLDRTRNVARFSDAHDAKYSVRASKHDQVLDSISLPSSPSAGGSKAEERKSHLLIHLGVVGCSIKCIRSTSRLKEPINKIIWNSKRAQHVARGVRCIYLLTTTNDRSEIF